MNESVIIFIYIILLIMNIFICIAVVSIADHYKNQCKKQDRIYKLIEDYIDDMERKDRFSNYNGGSKEYDYCGNKAKPNCK